MATIGNNFQKSQIMHQQMLQKEIAQGGNAQAKSSAASVSGQLNNAQAKESKQKAPSESVQFSDKFMKLEAEKAEETQSGAQAQQSVADDALVQNKSTKRKDIESDNTDYRVGPGDVQEKKTAGRVFALDDDEGTTYEVSETQGHKMDELDKRTPEHILSGMPEGARTAAKATLDTQIKSKGTDKVAALKSDPKIDAIAEDLDLELVHTLKESATPAPILDAKSEPPMVVEPSEHEQQVAKEMALKQAGQQEAFVA